MREARIVRLEAGDHGVRGVFMLDGRVKYATLEDAWRNNQPNVSCIPTGRYICSAIKSPKFGPTYEVLSVPGRSLIRFHPGNSETDTEGCILLGLQYTELNGQPRIAHSVKAFQRFLLLMQGVDAFALTIIDCCVTRYDPPLKH